MSSSFSSVNKENNKLCKLCLDAGKAEVEYRSHFVKSEVGGKVICPTLQEMVCTYCKRKGHMKSYCVILKKNMQRRNKDRSRCAYESRLNANSSQSSNSNSNSNSKSNAFDALCCASDSDSDLDTKEDFPALCCGKEKVYSKSYARAVSTTMVGAAVSTTIDAMVGAEVSASKKLSWVEMDGLDSDEEDADEDEDEDDN
jgi:hypothetical protein